MTHTPINAGRMQDGRFKPGRSGNPKGKRPGTRHRMTLAVQTLLEGEAEALTRKAIGLALAGDTTALRLCMERLLPPRRDVPLTLDLPPVQSAADLVKVQFAIMQAVAQGHITPTEATALCDVAEHVQRAIESEDIEKRLTALEHGRGKKNEQA